MSIGLILKGNIPIKNSRYTPYILFGIGKPFEFYQDASSKRYMNLGLGYMYSIQEWIQIRPEICYVLTSSESSGFAAPSITTKQNYFGFNLAFEIDLANVF
jgi:hypothetical protein